MSQSQTALRVHSLYTASRGNTTRCDASELVSPYVCPVFAWRFTFPFAQVRLEDMSALIASLQKRNTELEVEIKSAESRVRDECGRSQRHAKTIEELAADKQQITQELHDQLRDANAQLAKLAKQLAKIRDEEKIRSRDAEMIEEDAQFEKQEQVQSRKKHRKSGAGSNARAKKPQQRPKSLKAPAASSSMVSGSALFSFPG